MVVAQDQSPRVDFPLPASRTRSDQLNLFLSNDLSDVSTNP
jgi:hypothetical protein